MRFGLYIGVFLFASMGGMWVCAPASLSAAELPSLEKAAEALTAATVTVRASKTNSVGDVDPATKAAVFSGVVVGDGLIACPLFAATDTRVRITFPGGAQAEAQPAVLDEYSGLALLAVSRERGVPIPLMKTDAKDEDNDHTPKPGAWVVSAAAWGAQDAVVSVGVVAGVDRVVPNSNFPPLLQLDMRTAETSSGAGIANTKGELLAIIVADGNRLEARGWTYAAPVSHVQRLVRTYEASKGAATKRDDGVIIIQRRRPVVGMILEGQPDEVRVDKVSDGGPAHRAGIEAGDEILAVDGVKIRNVYQAARPVLFRQPGDRISYLVRKPSGVEEIAVTLGGGVRLESAPGVKLAQFFPQKLDSDAKNALAGKPPRHIAEVGDPEAPIKPAGDGLSPEEKIEFLQKSLDRYRSAVAFLQGRHLQEKAKTDKQIADLQAQIKALQQELEKATKQD